MLLLRGIAMAETITNIGGDGMGRKERRAQERAQAKLGRSQERVNDAREAAKFMDAMQDEMNRRMLVYGKSMFDSLMTQLLYTLHEEYGFKRKRLEKVMDSLYYQQTCIAEGYVTEEDMLDVLRNEAKMQIELMGDDDNVVDELLSEIKGKKKKPSGGKSKTAR